MKTNRRGGLGRGLGALIPSGPAAPEATQEAPAAPVATVPAQAAPPATPAPVAAPVEAPVAPAPTAPVSVPGDQLAPVPGARFRELPIDSIVPNSKQPRQIFDEDALEELKASIREVGFLQPIVVRETAPGKYELIMGERRWRSAQAIGLTAIPAIIRETADDAMLRDALLENIHRANLNPLEEGAAYQQLLEEFGATHEELSRRIGRSRPQITNTIRLLNLPAGVQRRVAAGVLSAGHARALLSLDNAEAQEALALRIVAEGLSVRVTEELVSLGAPETRKAPAARRPKAHAPALGELAEKLCDRFDTKVRVDLGKRKGKITIEFATVDDLERIVGVIGLDRPAE
ncbi:chromosome partitioning protein ParB [Longispora fulva]|uniref:ParB family chromosome partitioning protein n=1 Tax=Longispora fulva TaxID=619741 RepID=A0A8J7GU97_9ACTN|nr:ParB/RepB/Spo0J family partition protein [Longispora fulva]MBG6139625.1 ParB family chromosome partitioning protein [Longispora fulva]GIG57993.1 chromosome partitioning protein ParB [Longispora fulva]